MLEAEVARLREENASLLANRAASPHKGSAGVAITLVVSLGAGVGAWYAGFVVGGRDGEMAGLVLGGVGLIGLATAIGIAVLTRLLIIVPPHRVGVIIGGRGAEPGGGLRFVSGGRVLLVPLLQKLEMLPDGPFALDTTFRGLSGQKGPRVDVHVRARLSLSRHEADLGRAAERFLGQRTEDVLLVLRETIEAAARSLVIRVDVAELEDDLERAAQKLTSIAEQDLWQLGLTLDTLHVLEIKSSAQHR
jgi:flotillin